MKITCQCGHLILDQTDGLPDKAHFVPDQAWFGLLEELDGIISATADGKLGLEEARITAASTLIRASRPIHQCPACGTVLIHETDRTLALFRPIDGNTKPGIFHG